LIIIGKTYIFKKYRGNEMGGRHLVLSTAVTVLLLLFVMIPAGQAEEASDWIFYDGGIAAHAGSSFKYQGVRFSLASDVLSAPLLTISFFYSHGQCPVTVHVTGPDHRTELVTPIKYTAIDGWNDIDVTALNILVPHNFYIILEGNGCGYPYTDDESSAYRSFKGKALRSLDTRLSHNLLIQAEAGSPVSIPALTRWDVKVVEKVKLSIKKSSTINWNNYFEQWTLHSDGSYATENDLYYGSWKQKGSLFKIILDPEDTRTDIIKILENMLYDDIADVIVTKIDFTWTKKKNGTITGKCRIYAAVRFPDNRAGSIFIERIFTGTPTE
jgi:hypothetical protein